MATFQHPGALREAQRLIQHALDNGETHLDLSGLRLRQLPEELTQLANQLVSLDLSGCAVLSDIETVKHLTRLTHLDIQRCYALDSLTGLKSLKILTHLNLGNCNVLTSLSSISHLSELIELDISGNDHLTSLEGINNLTELTSLNATWCSNLVCLSGIEQLYKLTRLFIFSEALEDFTHISSLENLSVLHVSSIRSISSLNFLLNLTNLTELQIDFPESTLCLAGLEQLTGIKRLSIFGHSEIDSLLRLKKLTNLERLELIACDNFRSLDGIQFLSHLKELDLQCCENLKVLTGIERCKKLTKLNLSECAGLSTLLGIEHLPELTELDISHIESLENLEVLEHLLQLKQFKAFNCKAFSDVTILKRLSRLEKLGIGRCNFITSLSDINHLTNLRELDLPGCQSLESLDGLEKLTLLTSLTLSKCSALSRLNGIEGLINLRNLWLDGCKLLKNLDCLSYLENLRRLDIEECVSLECVSGLDSLRQLTRISIGNHPILSDISKFFSLKNMEDIWIRGAVPVQNLEHFKDLLSSAPRLDVYSDGNSLLIEHTPAEITQNFDQVAFEDWCFECEQHGVEIPKSLKVMLLGNGRIGKTQLARRLRQETFDETVPSTHGIQLHKFHLPDSEVELKSWDFGGQDVYLGTHSLFIDQRALYLLLWHPDFENNDQVACEQLLMRNRPLSYWLAYLKSLAGDQANVLVCQSQCDSPEFDRPAPIPHPHPFPALRPLTISTKVADGLDVFLPSFERAIKQQLKRNGEVWLPKSWLAVEQEIYLLNKHKKQLSFEEFEDICFEYEVAAPMTLANFLHQSGVLFYRCGHFDDHLILDQQWALQGVYLLLDRQHVLPQLKACRGRFTLGMLEHWIVQHRLDSNDSDLFLEMMQQCGACFKVDGTHYIAPDNLEELDANDAQQIWQQAREDIELELHYSFLHDATMRFLLSKIGEVAKAHAYYWRYGCCFYDGKHHVKVWFQCELDAVGNELLSNFSQPGKIIIRLAGSQSNQLAKHLLESITKTHHLGQSPEVNWIRGEPSADKNEQQERKQAEPFSYMGPAALPPVKLPSIYFSYAWGKEEDARQQASDQLYEKLKTEKLNVFRDKNSTKVGSSIADFERQIGAGDFALVILSQKYLYESAHCMKELAFLYEYSLRQQTDFTKRVIPVVLQDINIDSPIERLKIVSHWQEKMAELQALIDKVGSEAAGASSVDELQLMRAFINCIVNALTWISDLVTERQQDLQVEATLELVKSRVEEYMKSK
ncbi:internalin A [Rheinheimera pacifica]|uniref:COR domain-containing protein n=1 Tax=Rheinheimera pacifica TaxID=173990 RepID=UPI0028642E5F|nr:COR domain-containing protein [Rheinheimera pacifica]MDR6982241.1 internalin A [Rheinheimera pacifica]